MVHWFSKLLQLLSFSKLGFNARTGKVAQWVKLLAAKLGNLSLNSESHRVGEK